MIDMTLMSSDWYTTLERTGEKDAAPLKIVDPVFEVRTIVQDSAIPCDNNTISVVLQSTVPLFASCATTVTIVGLEDSDTEDTTLPLNVHYGPIDQEAVWEKTAGSLTFEVVADWDENAEMSFDFVLRNRAAGRASTENSIYISASGDIVFDEQSMPLPAGQAASDYPIYVEEASLTTTEIEQSDEYPCDLNTISVSLVSNVALLAECSPKVIITNLRTEYQTLSTNALQITDSEGGVVTGTWDQAAGTVEVSLVDMLSAQDREGFKFEFVVRNPKTGYAAQTATISGDISSVNSGGTHPIASALAMSEGPTCSGDECKVGYVTVVNIQDHMVMQQIGDGVTGFKPTDPCSPVTITVSFTTTVPLVAFCETKLTISGLVASYAGDSAYSPATIAPVESTGTFVYESGSYSGGSFVMVVASDSTQGQEYDITFDVTQRADASSGVTQMTASLSGLELSGTDPLPLELATGENTPLSVAALEFSTYIISQSSPFPCDNNTITVTLETSALALWADCTPKITINDLVDTQTPDDADLSVMWDNSEVSADWTNAGILTLTLPFSGDWATEWEFSFELVNQKIGTGGTSRDPQLDASLESSLGDQSSTTVDFTKDQSSPTSYDWLDDTNVGQTGDRYPLLVRDYQIITQEIEQSSPYPCDSNTITVVLATSVPLIVNTRYPNLDCSPSLTITGLTGSQTEATNGLQLIQAGD
eukprot:1261716-Rhodomonas_salina.1